jgi:small subunit ribosomal protein S18
MAKPIAKPKYTKTENKKWEGGGKYQPARKFCAFCADKAEIVDYKDSTKLRRYISDRGKIEPRRRTGTCAKHQRALALAIKKARHLALLPYTAGHIRRAGAPTFVAAQATVSAAPASGAPVAVEAPAIPVTTVTAPVAVAPAPVPAATPAPAVVPPKEA